MSRSLTRSVKIQNAHTHSHIHMCAYTHCQRNINKWLATALWIDSVWSCENAFCIMILIYTQLFIGWVNTRSNSQQTATTTTKTTIVLSQSMACACVSVCVFGRMTCCEHAFPLYVINPQLKMLLFLSRYSNVLVRISVLLFSAFASSFASCSVSSPASSILFISSFSV